MELNNFFEEVGGSYNEVISRLGKDERIVKYLIRFVESDPMSDFDRALGENNIEDAFRALHSIKGMCLNLGLGALGKSSSELCEEYRHGAPEGDVSELTARTRADYATAIAAIKKLTGEGGEQKGVINVSNDQIARILKMLIKNCDEMYVDGIDSNIAELSKCVLSDDLKVYYQNLVKYADGVAIAKIEEEAKSMLIRVS